MKKMRKFIACASFKIHKIEISSVYHYIDTSTFSHYKPTVLST